MLTWRGSSGWGRWVAGVALLAMAAAGCGTRAPQAPAAATAPPLRVATSGDYPPFSLVDADGDLTGMDIEIALELGRTLNRPVQLNRIAWSQLADAMARGEFDVAMGGITMRADRAVVGRFTRPYAQVGAMALVRTRDAERFESIDALDRPGVRIAVNAGGHLERLARARFPQAAIEAVPDNSAVPKRLRDGDADAALTDSAEVRLWLEPGLTALGPFTTDDKSYLLPADRGALAAQIDTWLTAREADGWLDQKRLRWIGPDAGMDAATAARNAVIAFVRLRLALAPAIAAAKRAGNLAIEDPAQEAKVLERVRAASKNGNQVAAVYQVLIELSKAVQRSDAPADLSATLPTLRAALLRIDETLVPLLGALPPTTAEQWSALLGARLDLPGVTPELTAQLAAALSAVGA